MAAPTTPTLPAADRNLLFAVLAFQAGYLDAPRFAEVCSTWSVDSTTPLGELLVSRGWITAAQRAQIQRRLPPPERDPALELPVAVTTEEAVERAYPGELADVTTCLERGLSVLIECQKDLTPYLYARVAGRLRVSGLRCGYLDGRPQPEARGMILVGPVAGMLAQMREAVNGAAERRVVVLPHLDLLSAGPPELSREARDTIPLLYENPEI